MDSIGVTGGCNEIDTKTRQVKKRCIQNVGVGLTTITASGGNLSELQRPAKELFKMILCVVGKSRQGTVADKSFTGGCTHTEILAESDKCTSGHIFASAAESTLTQINFTFADNYRILGTYCGALVDHGNIAILVNLRQPTKSLIQLNGFFGVICCFMALLDSIFNDFQHDCTFRHFLEIKSAIGKVKTLITERKFRNFFVSKGHGKASPVVK